MTLVTNAILRLSCALDFVTKPPQMSMVHLGDTVTNRVRTPKNTLAGVFWMQFIIKTNCARSEDLGVMMKWE